MIRDSTNSIKKAETKTSAVAVSEKSNKKRIKTSPPRKRKSKLRSSLPFLIMCAPAIIYLLLFHYLPITGVTVAFKDYDYQSGLFGGEWVGFKYFRFFFESNDATRVIFNTLGYSILFHVVGTFMAVLVAILLFEIRSKHALKIYQTSMTLPSFISWVLVAYIVFTILSSEHGIANQLLTSLGKDPINWYAETKYWPLILTITNIWKGVGMNCIVYYAALMGLDVGLFEAATLDGASRFRQIWHISLPSIIPIISMMSILAVGNIMTGNFGLFYQVPMDSGALYPVTDVIDTYVYRGLQSNNISQTAAVGLFQSVVGLILVLITNGVTRKVNPENAMF